MLRLNLRCLCTGEDNFKPEETTNSAAAATTTTTKAAEPEASADVVI